MSDDTPTTLMDELTAIKAVEDKLTANKVANFAYTDHAYNNPLTEADGVEAYDVNAEQNIPVANASTLKVNATILTKGWRAQASSITRMLMNHFLGRCSYNLNKLNDLFSTFLMKLMDYMEQPNGLATLDANGKVTALNNVVNTGDSATPAEDGTDKFTTGGAYTLLQSILDKAPKNHASSTTDYGVASGTNYGHVKTKTGAEFKAMNISSGTTVFELDKELYIICLTSSNTSIAIQNITFRNNSGSSYSMLILSYSQPSGSAPTGNVDTILKLPQGDATYLFSAISTIKYFVVLVRDNASLTTVN